MFGAFYFAEGYFADGTPLGTAPTPAATIAWYLQRFDLKPRAEETA